MKKLIPVIVVFIAVIVMFVIGSKTGWFGVGESKKIVDLYNVFNMKDSNGNNLDNKFCAIVLDGNVEEIHGIIRDDVCFIPVEYVQKNVNDRYYWGSTDKQLLYTTSKGIEEYSVDNKNVCIIDNAIYISSSLLEKYTNVKCEFYKNPKRLLITSKWDIDVIKAVCKEDTKLRTDSSLKGDILKDLKLGEEVYEMPSDVALGDWHKVKTSDGIEGYVEEKFLGDMKKEVLTNDFKEDTYSQIECEGKISLAWHPIYNMDSNAGINNILKSMKGVNVISPTWFSIKDIEGKINSFASKEYVNEAHNNGLKVWALISDFEKDDAGKRFVDDVLKSRETRKHLIDNILSEINKYNIDGINLDFEYIKEDNANNYLQFIRELSLETHKQNIVFSIDCYVPSAWSKYYNRKEQSVFADYLVMMGYDEHNNSSDEAGSVASLSFEEDGINNLLEQIGDDKSQKVISAIPFYTRIWKETPEAKAGKDEKIINCEDGNYALFSKAVGMQDALDNIAENNGEKNWDEEVGQYYAQYEKDDSTYKIWLEEDKSIQKKLDLIDKYNLKGAAYWSIGFQKSSIWTLLEKNFK